MNNVSLLFGVPIHAVTMRETLAEINSAIERRRSFQIGVINAAKIVKMHQDEHLMNDVLRSDAILADGMAVVWASRLLGKPLPERIAGIDLMHAIMFQGNVKGYKVFCLGATQAVLDSVAKKFASTYPGVTIVGCHHGYFDDKDAESVAQMIRASKADILFVAMTTPKKEQFIAQWTPMMSVPVVHGVGGSFDVVAGLVKRAPPWWQKVGLEWLYRVLQEPKRLFKRYFFTNFAFIILVLKSWWAK